MIMVQFKISKFYLLLLYLELSKSEYLVIDNYTAAQLSGDTHLVW